MSPIGIDSESKNKITNWHFLLCPEHKIEIQTSKLQLIHYALLMQLKI